MINIYKDILQVMLNKNGGEEGNKYFDEHAIKFTYTTLTKVSPTDTWWCLEEYSTNYAYENITCGRCTDIFEERVGEKNFRIVATNHEVFPCCYDCADFFKAQDLPSRKGKA